MQTTEFISLKFGGHVQGGDTNLAVISTQMMCKALRLGDITQGDNGEREDAQDVFPIS